MAHLTFGLDIGIASVGWAVLNEQRIVDLGVRAFDKAETAQEGEPLNKARRDARLARRRLYRRAWRLKRLVRLLHKEGLIDSVKAFPNQASNEKGKDSTCVWQLRCEGLDRALTPLEWARVIYHLCKHRGFHWVSKAEQLKADSGAEGGKVKQGLKHTATLMQEKGYRTAAEMICAEYPAQQRNKGGQYDKALSRVLLAEEFALLFAAQRRLGNTYASERFEELVLGSGDCRSGLFWEQKPALSGADLLKMLGKCTFEKGEYRAPKASFTAERHVWLTRLNNLRVLVDGQMRPLNEAERAVALPLPYQTEAFKYKTLKKALVKAGLWNESIRFGGLAYPSEAQKESGKAKDPEDQTLVKMQSWHQLRKAFKGYESVWRLLSTPALEGAPELLDSIALVLSVYKDDAEIEEQLKALNLPSPDICLKVLMSISFDKFSNLSLKALRQIVPLMETGLRYDEAVESIPEYGHHSQLKSRDSERSHYLPPFYEEVRTFSGKHDRVGSMKFREDMDIPRNPVVLRALNQARKVVNALIKEYGSPAAVHIEMARDLSRPLSERRKIKKLQESYRDENEKARKEFESNFGFYPKGQVFEKWMLYREQQCQCAYSLAPLDIHRVLSDQNYCQVDHAIPYSRSYDDSKNNRVLVLTKENQDKGNRTPYEYLTALDGGEEGGRWRAFNAWVEGNKAYRHAKRSRLLRKNYGKKEEGEFIERNLNDTRYICRFFKNYVEQHLQLAPREDGDTNRRCVVVSGQLTAFLRMHWGLQKDRAGSDRHHALDAAVVAACTHGMVKRLSDYSRTKEVAFLREGLADLETGEITNPAAFRKAHEHFPAPWPHFRHELRARLLTDDIVELREDMQRLGTYSEEDLAKLRTLFVSRAPKRRSGGLGHRATVYSQPEGLVKKELIIEKKELSKLKLSDFKDMFDREDGLVEPVRNKRMYEAILERLDAHGGVGEKAFGPHNPFYKPDRNGNPTGPEVKSVKVISKSSGIPVRGGLANNGDMIRMDVFEKGGRFFLVPVYAHHRVTGLPNRAIIDSKPEDKWTLIDEGFLFRFSVYPNDFLRVTLKNCVVEGYYSTLDRSNGKVSFWAQDRSISVGKNGAITAGLKTALSIEKFDVDILGRKHPCRQEQRRGLA